MKKIFILIFIFIACETAIADNLRSYIDQGIRYHNKGFYEKAIKEYKKVLKIDPESILANYEIALSHYMNKNYHKAIEYSDIVIKKNLKYIIPAYVLKGSALDLLGKTIESIQLFENAIKKTGGSNLLYYNLGVNYFKINKLKESELNAIEAIKRDHFHSGSHFLLAKINNRKQNTVKTLLATYYFLLLESDGKRAIEALKIMEANFSKNVTKNKGQENIFINILSDNNGRFGSVESMVALIEASRNLEKYQDMKDSDFFILKTRLFFNALIELHKDDKRDIWNFYISFFNKIVKSEHLNAFCHAINQVRYKDSANWVNQNEEKLQKFGSSLNRFFPRTGNLKF